jgi:N-sulfoglucosamine sulfohydrolase
MEKKPNIVWVSFEDCLPLFGCYGDNVATTPNVDKLASEGCIYPNAFSSAPICAPARAGVITGMYPTSIGAHNMRISQPRLDGAVRTNHYDAPTPHFVKCLGEYFRREGYYCSNNAKTDYQFTAPFAAWDDCSEGAHWRDRPDPTMPFFAVFNPEYTHESGMWEDMRSRPVMVEPEPAFEAITDPDLVEVPPYFPDTPRVRKSIAKNYDNIAQCDKVMGQLLEHLEEDGLIDDTIVVLWSDHGPMPRGKRHIYDSGIHSPMVVRWPGKIDPGTINERLVSTIDLGATMLSACGITVPPHMQGQAFLGDQESPERQYTFASVDRSDMDHEMVRAVRDKRYKYIKNGFPEKPYLVWNRFRNNHPIMQEWYRCWLEGSLNQTQSVMFADKRPVEELYDTNSDPHEVNNLAEDDGHREVLVRMREELNAWQKETGDLGLVEERVLKHMHYPDEEKPECKEANCLVFTADSYGQERAPDSFSVPELHKLQLFSGTPGCSISYSLHEGEKSFWRIFTSPLSLPAGRHRLHTIVSRIGCQNSEEKVFDINVE